jgi:predicted 3-demethylubiquinone-9 3-methyltransferase (glyoxalase superfamily)
MQKITPFLWFNGSAEEAAQFYVSVFENSGIRRVTRYGEAGPGPKGSAMTVQFAIDGQEFVALNGGPQFTFTPAISFLVHCQTQEEVDRIWNALSAGGSEQQCGWLQDRYGLSWQVIPGVLPQMLQDEDPQRGQAVMQAMMKMKKIDIARLEDAYQHAHAS